ncbi:subtype I-F CRISPR-associated endonuclease Cas1, partial [Halorhodospira halochloris]|nr:subtype I-F CRISPR-associated endonuclease Cas1 [Halorhodospira halochloris]
MERIRTNWLENRALLDSGFEVAGENLTHLIDANRNAVDTVNTNSDLLTLEARLTKELFGIAARTVGYGDFARAKRGS